MKLQNPEAARIIDDLMNFDPDDISERICRAHRYSVRCERLRDEHTVKIIESLVDFVLSLLFIVAALTAVTHLFFAA